jgi:2-octaprenylphenol hydroxylase
MQQTQLDVIVLGAGIVGMTAALALERQGLRVGLVDSKSEQAYQPQQEALDARIYAITPGNVAYLSKLNVWQRLSTQRICPVNKMQIWADPAQAPLAFDAFESGLEDLGAIVESAQLQFALLEQMHSRAIPCWFASAPQQWRQHDDYVELTLADSSLTAKLLIGADGANSWLRQQCGIAVERENYAHNGVVANFKTALPHGNIARQWFIGEDILAWLPLPNQQISMVWSTKTPDVLMQLTAEQLSQHVAAAGAYCLGDLQCVTPAQAFPLSRQRAQQTVQPRVALIGDAAHLVHPMAGQGVNLGLRDVVALAEVLAEHPRDIGDYLLLRKYERARKLDVISMQTLTGGLCSLFSHHQPWLKRLREWAMPLPNRHEWLKQWLLRQATR